jgi:subtilisin family serine protease
MEEENTNGLDNDGHGSHVASIAAGNRLNILLNGSVNEDLSGVAPRANIVAYRACYVGVPPDPEGGGCQGTALLQAIDQAVTDGVDVINYSIGTEAGNPWFDPMSRAFLSAREAGVFVATSAGNFGPGEGTVGLPAIAPWITAVGYATHDGVFGNVVENLSGGDTDPPDNLVGASYTDGIGVRRIVHARDYGNALCGVGESEDEALCENLEGSTNPWDGEQPFNGEIVVCDRGEYGRVEKGNNVRLAGAGGYILANTEGWGESIIADDHCLPAVHIGKQDGDLLREWLGSGGDHQGSISGFDLVRDDRFADQVDIGSSRGPNAPPVEGVLKPNLIAPGEQILAATESGEEFGFKSGTSMASPHVAGAAALLKSVNPGWGPNEIGSALETTATAALATDMGDTAANAHVAGAGRPQLAEAARAGLYLDESASAFLSANPAAGGEPKTLNLPGLVDHACAINCTFQRTVTDLVGGANWDAEAVDFPAGVQVDVSPRNFSLASGASRQLEITLDLSGSPVIEDWLFGRIRLSSDGLPDQFLTVAVYSDSGKLPGLWSITDDRDGGWAGFGLTGLVALPDATFTAGGLVRRTETIKVIKEDLSRDNPYDGGEGVFTVWHALPEGALWLYAEIPDSTAVDIDLFVGRDNNGNGIADPSEELCSSTSEFELERCDLFDVPAGDYWVLVQNWDGTNPEGDSTTLWSAGIGPGQDARLAATGPGQVGALQSFPVRVSWDNLNALPGEVWLGAVGVGTTSATPNNVGVIPVRFTRSGIAAPETFPLMPGIEHRLALDGNSKHDRLFIDVPPGTGRLTFFVNGTAPDQNDALTLELKRLDFEAAMAEPPFAVSPGAAPVLVSSEGTGGAGPSITVVGVEPGRWYPVTGNRSGDPVAVGIRAELQFEGAPIVPRPGLWEPSSRPGLGQGFDYNHGGPSGALVWYSYDEEGRPAWYLANNPVADGNIWSAELLRFTNDGARQHFAKVGRLSVASLAEDDLMFSYTLFGRSGSERMKPVSLLTCPGEGAAKQSYTGVWFRGVDGLGGASVLVNAERQGQIHYLFDDQGNPRWLLAQDTVDPAPSNPEIPLLQYSGYCPVCAPSEVAFLDEPVGLVTRSFSSETEGNWTLDYVLEPPLQGSAARSEAIVKLTHRTECE